jgi:hypothetical protein
MNHEAIYKLNPSVITIRGETAYDANGNEVAYDKSAVAAYVSANAYKAQRAAEYPNIVDQLDTLFHEGIDGWKETIQAVKTKYPKP